MSCCNILERACEGISKTVLPVQNGVLHTFIQTVPQLDEVTLRKMRGALSASENKRAERLVTEEMRRIFIVSHAALRAILAVTAGRELKDVAYVCGEYGKPYLEGRPDIGFNMSHSGKKFLIAFTGGCELGADIQREFTDADILAIARQYFSSEERFVIDREPPEEKKRTFFRIWTLKEAYLKMTGTGLSVPLRTFSVSGREEGGEYIINDRLGLRLPVRAHAFAPEPEYHAALVVNTKERMHVRIHNAPLFAMPDSGRPYKGHCLE